MTYSVGHAEEIKLEDSSADLVTVAQAIHWFDIPQFYKEARRVLKTGGVLSFWWAPFTYELFFGVQT